MGKVVTYQNDKRRKDFLARFESNHCAAAEYLFGVVLSPSKRRFFNEANNLDRGLIVDNQLGSIVNVVAVQSAILHLLLGAHASVNVVVRDDDGAEADLIKVLTHLIKRVARKEPWLIEYMRLINRDTLVVGNKRSVHSRLQVISYNENTVEGLAGFGDVLWILPAANAIDSKAMKIMSFGSVMAFADDLVSFNPMCFRGSRKPPASVALNFERCMSY